MPPTEISHYRIIGKLGAGGMGEVFLAEDSTLGRKVAIKMLSERRDGSELARQRLINEAKAAAALDHPNICSIHEVGEEDDRVFIVMQYIDGQSLAERIRKNPLLPGEVVEVGMQAAQALAEAHAAGIIHRDIKPQNIIVTPRGQVKVLDFGLATIARHDPDAETKERLTEAGSIVGTPGYMSPEQLRGKSIDPRSDIFSLGVTLYECATGMYAFERGSSLEVSLRVVTETPPPPSERNPAVPPGLDRIIARAMAKDPKSPFKALPKGAEMIVAMRRSIRVGPRAGSPLEEFGVAPDEGHLMTRRDILEDNCDLMATAARLIRKRPSFTLSVTPVSRKGTRAIVVSAASKLPSSKAGRGISRVDVYANNRPVRSIDAQKGVVPSTQVTIGKAGNKPMPVEVGAYDDAGRLVAFRRTAVR